MTPMEADEDLPAVTNGGRPEHSSLRFTKDPWSWVPSRVYTNGLLWHNFSHTSKNIYIKNILLVTFMTKWVVQFLLLCVEVTSSGYKTKMIIFWYKTKMIIFRKSISIKFIIPVTASHSVFSSFTIKYGIDNSRRPLKDGCIKGICCQVPMFHVLQLWHRPLHFYSFSKSPICIIHPASTTSLPLLKKNPQHNVSLMVHQTCRGRKKSRALKWIYTRP